MTFSLCASVVALCMISAFATAPVSSTKGSIRAPRKIKDAEPVYPAESLKAGDEGAFIVEMSITPAGTVGDVQILLSSCERLSNAVLAAVRQWRYESPKRDGKPIPFSVTAVIPMRLPAHLRARAGGAGACRWKEPPKPIARGYEATVAESPVGIGP